MVQLPERLKSWLGIIFGVLLIVLFISSFFSGREKPQLAQQPAPTEIHQYESQQTPVMEETDEEVQPVTEEAASDAQAVLPGFLEAFVPFDAEQPNAYLERVKPYLTPAFYEQLASIQRRGTLARSKTEYMEAEWTPADLQDDSQWYNVDVSVIHTATDGTQEKGLLLYVVMLKLVDNKWLIDDFGIRSGSGAVVNE